MDFSINGHKNPLAHHQWRVALLLCFMPMLVLSECAAAKRSAVPASARPKYLNLGDPDGVTQAMRTGDSNKLKKVSQIVRAPILKSYALAAYYRSIYQIQTSSRYAKICYDEGLKDIREKYSGVIYCGDLLAGNYAIDGRIADWARTMQTTRDQVAPVVENSLHYSNVIFPHFGSIGAQLQMKEYYIFPREKMISHISNDTVIPRILPSKKALRPNSFSTGICKLGIRCFGSPYYVMVNVNGHNVLGVLDTGTTKTVVTPSEVHRLGIHVSSSPYYKLVSTKTAQVPSHLGYIKSMGIATAGNRGIQIRDVAVQVGGALPKNIRIVLGMNIISKLGSVLFKENGIVVHPTGPETLCREPLHISSTLPGGYTVLFPYQVDQQLQNIALDTGQNQYLFGTSAATAKRSSALTMVTHSGRMTGDVDATYYPARIYFGSGSSAKNLTIAVFPHYDESYPYVMGADIFQDYNIFIDFKRGTACLFRR